MGETPQMPQPTDQHRYLAEMEGQWKVACKFFMDPSQPPMEMDAEEEVRLVGGFHTVSRFTANMFGMPFEGCCTNHFDPIKGCFVSTWADSVGAHFWVFEGNLEESGDLVMTARGPRPGTQEMADFRSVTAHNDDGSRDWHMAMATPDGGWHTMMEYRYTRP